MLNQINYIKLTSLLSLICLNCSAVEPNKLPSHWGGDASLDFSYYQSDYVSRTMGASTDLTHKYEQHETVVESTFDKQSINLPGASTEISRFRYDANVKWKYFYAATPYYSYLSPRIRHNDSGNYTAVQAMRLGGGRKFLLEDQHCEISVEAGLGYRYATMYDQRHIQEQLVIFSTKALWDLSPSIAIKFKLTHEQSALEKYRTTSLELRNKLTENFSLKTQVIEKRTYPYDISTPNGELTSSIGIDYEI